MPNTTQGGLKVKETMIAKYGSEEAWKDFMRSIAATGGKKGKTGGFWYKKYVLGDVEAVKAAGKKGGHSGKRTYEKSN